MLCFGKRLFTCLSLSCTILMIAYLSLTTSIYIYCIWHFGSEPFALCLALDRYWPCYSTNYEKKLEQPQVLKDLTVRFPPFIQSIWFIFLLITWEREGYLNLWITPGKKLGQLKHTHFCLKMGCGIKKKKQQNIQQNIVWRDISLNF